MSETIINKMSELIGQPFTPSTVQQQQLAKSRYSEAEIAETLADQVEAIRQKLAKELGVPKDLRHLVPAAAIADRVNIGLPTRSAGAGGSDTALENGIPGQTAYDIGLAVGAVMGGGEQLGLVALCYKELLGRDPDGEGFQHYQDRLDADEPRYEIIRDIELSPEATGRKE